MLRRTVRLAALALSLVISGPAQADSEKEFRISTGSVGGTYYPIGQIIAQSLSKVPKVKARAITSPGSVENAEAVSKGWTEAAFIQSDIAYWAYTGSGLYKDQGKPLTNLRAMASLYPESIHLVVRRAAEIKTLGNLKGKKVSLGDKASGTLADARIVLAASGIDEARDIQARYLSPEEASAAMIIGDIDAFFSVAGFPADNVSRALDRGSNAYILPISGPGIADAVKKNTFLSHGLIPNSVYHNRKPIPTINVNALMIVSESADPELIYRLTKAL